MSDKNWLVPRRIWGFVRGAFIVLAAVCFLLWPPAVRNAVEEQVAPSASSEESWVAELPEPEPEPIPEVPVFQYPVGKLSISESRKNYTSGEIVLEIPRLDLVCPVINGTGQAELNQGVGLFEYAHLPGPYNSNTSLAGHRDIGGMEFYYIDTITDGDLIYLSYMGKRYIYEYMETFITHDSDWDPIRAKDFACITLQSCDPIGTALNRIFVIGRLIDIEDE